MDTIDIVCWMQQAFFCGWQIEVECNRETVSTVTHTVFVQTVLPLNVQQTAIQGLLCCGNVKEEKFVQKTNSVCFTSFEINTATTEEQTSNNSLLVKEEVTKSAILQDKLAITLERDSKSLHETL